MSDRYYFHNQFKCMYCKDDFDSENRLSLGSGENVDLKCKKCGAVWKFWVSIQLNHKLVGGGKFNKEKQNI